VAEPRFTRGPWRKFAEVHGDGRVYRREVYGPAGCGRGGNPIASIPDGFTDNDANHDLIWAAPDLYAACEEAVRWIEEDTWVDLDELSDGLKAVLATLRAATAKARGDEVPDV
jgi:hypothetical protein